MALSEPHDDGDPRSKIAQALGTTARRDTEQFRLVELGGQLVVYRDQDLLLGRSVMIVMSLHTGDGREDDAEDGDRPEVPEGVLRGIDDLAEGDTASKEDVESALKF